MNVNFFYEVVNRKIKQLFDAGLIDFYAKDFFEPYSRNSKSKDDARVLTLNELEGGFVVCHFSFVQLFLLRVDCQP